MRPLPSPGLHVAVPLRFAPGIDYYALLWRAESHTVVTDLRYNKRDKDVHRTVIADVNGPLRLTVPVEKPDNHLTARWSDVRVSTHGDWWLTMLTALESAYGRTPFFEFYIDRFLPFFRRREPGRCETIAELDLGIHRQVCDILMIAPPTEASVPHSADFTCRPLPAVTAAPYWQVRADRLGFIPGMSILDLIFNLGPDAPAYLHRL